MNLLKILSASVLVSCALPLAVKAQKGDASPHWLVYKTKKDYSNYVMVELVPGKKALSYYPAPTDMSAIQELKPIALHKGYLLSRTGISANMAFLNMTIADYSKLKKVPTQAKLLKMIKDKSPVTELCDCGKRSAISEAQINELIDKGELYKKCKKMK